MKLFRRLNLFLVACMMLNHTAVFSQIQPESYHNRLKSDNICIQECNRRHISLEEFGIQNLIKKMVDKAITQGQEDTLSEGLIECYQSVVDGKSTVHIDSLILALPELLKEATQNARAPRPGQEIVSPGTCDLTQVIRLLQKIDHDVLMCCAANSAGFNGTFTVLNDIETTLTTCCANIQNNFNGTFTLIRSDFNQTFTVLNSINNTLTTCCAANAAGFNGTFTAINALNNLVISDFNQTFTVLNSINNTLTTCCAANATGFRGTFTAINALNNLVISDFNQTFTILNSINNTLTTCCAANAAGFAGTFTVLNTLLATNTTSANTNALLRASLCNPTLITQASYNAMPTPKTLTSGAYIFAENITYNPVAPGTAALTFSQPGILLDMGCFTLRQGNTIPTTNGIQLAANANDAEVRNGAVTDFSGDAIQFNSTTIERPYIHDVTILDAGVNGITLIGATPHSILHGRLEDIHIMHTGTSTINGTVRGFNLQNGDDFIIDTVHVLNSGNGITNFAGLLSLDFNNMQISNLLVNDNISGGQFNGVVIQGSKGCSLEDVTVLGNNSSAGMNGILMLSSPVTGNSADNNTIEDVMISTNTATTIFNGFNMTSASNNDIKEIDINNNTSSAGLRGFNIVGTSNNNVVSDSNINGNITSGAQFLGFQISTTGNLIENVEMAGNTVTGAAAIGAVIGNSSAGNMLSNVSFMSNLSTTTVIGFNASGIRNTYLNCNVFANTANGPAPSPNVASGFFGGAAPVNNNSFINCNVSNNDVTSSTIQFSVAGFNLGVAAINSRIENCLALDNVDLSGTTTSIGYALNGLSAEVVSSQAVGHTIGFDITGATTPVLTKNIASKNQQNYRGFPIGSTQTAADISQINALLTNPWTNIAIG